MQSEKAKYVFKKGAKHGDYVVGDVIELTDAEATMLYGLVEPVNVEQSVGDADTAAELAKAKSTIELQDAANKKLEADIQAAKEAQATLEGEKSKLAADLAAAQAKSGKGGAASDADKTLDAVRVALGAAADADLVAIASGLKASADKPPSDDKLAYDNLVAALNSDALDKLPGVGKTNAAVVRKYLGL